MFKSQKGKSAFLLKKNQEKKKAQEQLKIKQQTLKLKKNIRAFLARRRLTQLAQQNSDVRLALILRITLHQFSSQQIQQFISEAANDTTQSRVFFLSRFALSQLEHPQFFPQCERMLAYEGNEDIREAVFSHVEFLKVLGVLLERGQAARLLDLSAVWLQKQGKINSLDSKQLMAALLPQFSEEFLEVESPYGSCLNNSTIVLLLQAIASRGKALDGVHFGNFARLVLHFLKLSSQTPSNPAEEETISFCLSEFMRLGFTKHEQITSQLVKENQHLIALVEDEDLLQELESRLRQSDQLEEFSNEFLGLMEQLITHQRVLQLFWDNRCTRLHRTILDIVIELGVLFEDRRLIFVRQVISSDGMLRSLAGSTDPMFFQGLKMRLLAMDDQEFIGFKVFEGGDWQRIIDACVATADRKIQKLLQRDNAQTGRQVKLVPFTKRNSDELELKTVVDLLTNLHKKGLRTRQIHGEAFVSIPLSEALQGFLFGKGLRKVELLLRELPFVFSFESRLLKLNEFIREDKKNYDRNLFMHHHDPEDLVIAVRRGNEFQDAYDACMTRDLRRKYKIVFYNQQGLEEEGIDGGGIIKEFINRVLKASFSENYGLFMETARHQILPDPYSPFASEYEFVGRLVGKAVYEGINIEQKFAQPFLNLLIGRQNTFQDLQFVDPDVYNGLIALKHSTEDISFMEQTFVIYDKLPNGKVNYVDLLYPAKPPSPAHKHVLVTNQNKMQFILNYADFKCNKQIEQKTRLFRRGFLKVMKPEWLTMFNNQELNAIISGDNPDFNVDQLRMNTVYNGYHEKDDTIMAFWQVLREMSCQEKSLFLLFVTSCSRPPTLGFSSMKPKMCVIRDASPSHLPTASTCMNALRLPDYKNKALLKSKVLYAINAKAGFEFA